MSDAPPRRLRRLLLLVLLVGGAAAYLVRSRQAQGPELSVVPPPAPPAPRAAPPPPVPEMAPLLGVPAPSPEHVIKGNQQSMIYHVPGSPSYARTIAEVWFASEDDALAAGFRPPKTRTRKTD